MKNLKIIILLFLTFIFIYTNIISCDKNTKSKSSKITIEFWTISLKPLFTNYINNSIKEFEKQYPEYKIKWLDIPITSISRKLLTAIAGNIAPDVVNLNSNMVKDLANKNLLLEIKDKNLLNKYFKGALKGSYLYNKYWAIPWYQSTKIIIYNKDLIKKSNIKNLKIKNMKDLYKYSKIIKERTQITPIMPPIKYIQDLLLDGCNILDNKGKLNLFCCKQPYLYLENLYKLYKNKIIPPDIITGGYISALNRYQQGKLAILIIGPQFLTRIKNNSPDIYKISNLLPYPKSKINKIPSSVMHLAIIKKEDIKKQKAALLWTEYITSPKKQIQFCKLVAIMPTVKSALNSKYFKQLKEKKDLISKAKYISMQELKYAEDITVNLPYSKKRSDIIKELLENVLNAKNIKIEMKKAQKKWNNLIK